MTGDFPLRQLLTPAQTARHLGLTAQTLREWRVLGIGPAYIVYRHDPDLVRYDQLVVDAWMAANVQVRGAPSGTTMRLMERTAEVKT